MPTFAKLQCVECGHECWIEVHGSRPWDGDCPMCGTNAWRWQGWTDDWTEGISAAAKAAGASIIVLAERKGG